jgi:hypothetical protein
VMLHHSRGSSVSIVSDYGVDDRGSIPSRGKKDFSSSFRIQTGCRVHPAFYPWLTGSPFQGVKRGRGVTLTTYPI